MPGAPGHRSGDQRADAPLLVDEICHISRNLSPLEYLGYDVVVTEGGFKILEVNLHQDLHRYPLYPADVKEYLTERAAQKDKRFGPG